MRKLFTLKRVLLGLFVATVGLLPIAVAQVPGINSTIQPVFTLVYDSATNKNTYGAIAGNLAPAASATDISAISGSATRLIRVRRALLACVATSSITEPVLLIKRAAALPSDGTQTLASAVPYDTSAPVTPVAATAVVENFTANPTVGAPVGIVAVRMMTLGNLTTTPGFPVEFNFGDRGSAIMLRGAAQSLAINFDAITYSGGSCNVTWEWTEE